MNIRPILLFNLTMLSIANNAYDQPKKVVAIKDSINVSINTYFINLNLKLIEYKNIQKNNELITINIPSRELILGDTCTCIRSIKSNLFITKDLPIDDTSIIFSINLAQALEHFQERMGIVQSKKIDKSTIAEMNIPIKSRIKQIEVNLKRMVLFPKEIEKDFILVNIPEFKLHVFENKTPIYTANVVVGKVATQTQIFKGTISEIILNPFWNIPKSIINKEILPSIKKNSKYLVSHNMEVVSRIPLRIRQKPDINNSLGKIKFMFFNSYSIYLHDTPNKELFNISKRAFSHGCIRLSNPKDLALYLLKKDSIWNELKIEQTLATNIEKSISLEPRMPIYITYFTAWVNTMGILNFRNDIYDLDNKVPKQVF